MTRVLRPIPLLQHRRGGFLIVRETLFSVFPKECLQSCSYRILPADDTEFVVGQTLACADGRRGDDVGLGDLLGVIVDPRNPQTLDALSAGREAGPE